MNLFKKKVTAGAVVFCLALLLSTVVFNQVGYALPNQAAHQAQEQAANEVQDLELSTEELALPLAESSKIESAVTYSNGETDENVTWTSSDHTIATISEDGIVHASADKNGEVIITATSSRGRSVKSVDLAVTVYDPEKSIAKARTLIGEEVTVEGIGD
jgi:hypothetical protein